MSLVTPSTPDLTYADDPTCYSNRYALLDRGYAQTAPVACLNGRVYGVPVDDLSGPASGADFSAPVFRWVPECDVEWFMVCDADELDALASDLRERFSHETVATRDYVAQFPGGW